MAIRCCFIGVHPSFDKAVYKKILSVKKTGIAYDREEYIEGLIAVAVPLQTYREDLKAAIWALDPGLRRGNDFLRDHQYYRLTTLRELKNAVCRDRV